VGLNGFNVRAIGKHSAARVLTTNHEVMSENALAVATVVPAELMRLATDTAGLCRDIVTKTAVNIQGRNYVRVEGWMAIATAHGCAAGAVDVKQDEHGTSAVGEIRRISDGTLIARAEGFVGADEPTWYGGEVEKWRDGKREIKTMPRRPDYAIRAMAQTRAISRACRSAFAHVVVMMDAGLSTTPAEEVPHGGFNDEPSNPAAAAAKPVAGQAKTTEVPRDADGAFRLPAGVKWGDVSVHFGKNRGRLLSELEDNVIGWYLEKWEPKPYGQNTDISAQDKLLLAAVNAWADEKDAESGKSH
jgi:hypothetical protein